MKTNKIKGLTIFMALSMVFSSCEESVDPPDIIVGKVTAIGTPVGIAESTIIGSLGGSFSTSDNRLKIEVPAGAFATDQTLTIQPVTNSNAPGKGLAYRISPHDITFAKPVKLTFNYTEEEISSTFAEALAIAYQDENKVWQAVGGSEVDVINRSVSVYTTHFSDWSLFGSFHLIPATSTVGPGETIQLEVVGFFNEDDLLVPITPGQQAPIQEPRDLSRYVKQWTLGGAGVLKPNGTKATYSAPSQVPVVNPVAITVELDLKQKGQHFLVRNLFIGRPGIYLKLDNNEYFHMDGEVRYIPAADLTMLTGGTVIEGETRGIAIHWQGNISTQSFHWTSELPLFNYTYQTRYMYLHYYNQDISPGKLIVTGYGEVGGFVTGTFYLDAAGLLDSQPPAGTSPWRRKGKIEGYFRVKRAV